jgi:integrase/recombinase XerD
LSLSGAGNIFDTAFAKAGIIGASSHSCRRTALTWMHAAGVPLRVLQEISGHKDLGALQRYLEVTEEEIAAALSLLG